MVRRGVTWQAAPAVGGVGAQVYHNCTGQPKSRAVCPKFDFFGKVELRIAWRAVFTPEVRLPRRSRTSTAGIARRRPTGYNQRMMQTLNATRYITPLREGGSLPAIVEADDGELYVMKFVGAGQGAKALIAELVAGEIGRALGLPVPEIVLMTLDRALWPDRIRTTRSATCCKPARASTWRCAICPKPLGSTRCWSRAPDPGFASAVVWFDAYVSNVDRTPRNPNILLVAGWPVADRPRRGALLPSRRSRARLTSRAASPARSR